MREFTCQECDGEGRIEEEYPITDWTWGHDIGTREATCPTCGGMGTVEYSDLEDALRAKAPDYDEALAWAIAGGCDLIEARELLAAYGYNRPTVRA